MLLNSVVLLSSKASMWLSDGKSPDCASDQSACFCLPEAQPTLLRGVNP